MPCSPVSTRQRASPGSLTASAIASRIAWSSALRLAGLEMVSRRIPSAGLSMRSSPGMASGEASRSALGQAPRARRGGLVLDPVGPVGLGLLLGRDLDAGVDLGSALEVVLGEDDAHVRAARRRAGERDELEVLAEDPGLDGHEGRQVGLRVVVDVVELAELVALLVEDVGAAPLGEALDGDVGGGDVGGTHGLRLPATRARRAC